MEFGIYRGIKGYWRRRKYERLDPASGRRNGRKTRRFWRVRVGRRRLRILQWASPRRILARIRDGYVKMMLGFANSRVFGGGAGISFYGAGAAGDFAGFGRPALKEYDEKMIVEIYRSIVAQGKLIAGDGAIAAGDLIAV
ncbi:hypothetical protein QJS10_CPB04g00918 [Acorus calamus]|uniref:Uncharacterized protein n=1 Tax=Acorus calamus TaxID=4465 RepID=A0AAV9EYN3_ACOCL|nr:hypothetical protein QJS10_CPB04g00918 [Acorus calamus]